MVTGVLTRYVSPWKFAGSPRRRGASTERYSCMCFAGCSYGIPRASSIITLCESPMPRVKRPSAADCAVRACWAMTTGWRGKVGTTAVPISTRFVWLATTARAVSASKPKAVGIQTPWKPSASSSWARETRPATVVSPRAPRPIVSEIFILELRGWWVSGMTLPQQGLIQAFESLAARTGRGGVESAAYV